MTIIDRYVLRQFLRTFLVCFVSLVGLVMVIEAFTNLEEFIKAAKETNSGLLALMGSFYLFRTVLLFDLTAPLIALMAAMFTVSWFQKHHEMTALMSAGIPPIRIVAPIIAAFLVVIVLSALNRELFMPGFRDELARTPQDLVGMAGRRMDPGRDNRTGVLIQGKQTFRDRKRIDAPRFRLPLALHRYGRQITAKDAYYMAPEGNRPGGYLLDEVEEPKGLDQRPSLKLDGRPILITPADAPDWLEPDQCFVASELTFDQLTGGREFRHFSTPQLIAGLRNDSLSFRADVRVVIHARIVQPFLDATLLFLGLPLIVSRRSRNVFAAIGMGILVVTTFLLVVLVAQYLGSISVFSASLAAWLPLMLFVPPAVWLGSSMWQ